MPNFIPAVFIATTLLAAFIFYRATNKNLKFLWLLFPWLLVQSVLAFSGFLSVTDALPPRFAAIVLPPAFVVVYLFYTSHGKAFIDKLDLKALTLFHVIRIPVELVLYWLFLHKLMPQLMTFEGRNIDIVSGISAPIIFYLVFISKKLDERALLVWNIACLCILAFTVTNGILSAPSPFQQFGFDQPNTAIISFPFVWLPGTIVPLAYLSHLVAIRQLWKRITATKPDAVIA
ncbi:hypothetical protein [Aridibaculum aurantiacum]|uniref:hypothetical protein n=1 Tax=Aridibaculum aurantiacum TaxID=2810307 RepID=UPI001A96D065|nr:hypothetical protein [Aridibaculum aurantiacum]